MTQPPERDPLPCTIGPFRVEALLGQGGGGIVYRAVHSGTGQPAAVKTLSTLRPALLGRLRHEIHVLSTICHPGVVRILDSGLQDGVPWYAMELLRGPTLGDYARSVRRRDGAHAGAGDATAQGAAWWTRSLHVSRPARPAPSSAERAPRRLRPGQQPALPRAALRALLSVARHLCEPLAYLHGEGIVHRDLKPDNVLVRSGGMPVTVDFGLVSEPRAESGRERFELGGTVQGTVLYMSPEQARGEVVDARSDLYALGCILYELVTGAPPFTAPTVQELLDCHASAEPLPPSQRVAGLPAELDTLILRLLAKRQQERIGHALDVAAALEELGAEGALQLEMPAPRSYLYRPRLVGRASLLRRLEAPLERLEDGQGGLVLVRGESGAGKTRLLVELSARAAERELQVLAGEAVSVGTGSAGDADLRVHEALQVLRAPLRAIADRCRAEGPTCTRRLLGERGSLLARYEPALAGLPGLEAGGTLAELPPKEARQRLLRALAGTFFAAAQGRPLLLVLDDLQWADELSLGLLHHLLHGTQLAAAGLLLVGSYRAEEAGHELRRLWEGADVLRVELERLDEEAVGAMVREMLALEHRPAAFVRFLTRQSEGNPFFVAEYLRTAVAESLLYRDRTGRWQVDLRERDEPPEALYERLPLPRSIQALVLRHLEGLSCGARSLLECAAVVGRVADETILARMSSLQEAERQDGVSELLARQLVEPAESDALQPGLAAPASRLRIAHDKIREVAYAQIGAERRRALHRAAAEGLEAAAAGGDRPLAELGQHWRAAGVPVQAGECFEAAALQAAERGALEDAERLYRAYFELVPEPSLTSIRARSRYASGVLIVLGKTQEATEQQLRAVREARQLGHRHTEGICLNDLGTIYWYSSRFQDAWDVHDQALTIFRELGDREQQGHAVLRKAILDRELGRLEQAEAGQLEALALHRECGRRDMEAASLCNLANAYLDQGRTAEARPLYQQARQLFQELGDQRRVGIVDYNVGRMQADLGLLNDARSTFGEAIDLLRRTGDRFTEALGLHHLADVLREQGEHRQAEPLYAAALAVQREIGARESEGATLGGLAALLTEEGRLDEAGCAAEQAREIARSIAARRNEGAATIRLASLALQRGEPEAAAALLRQARKLLGERGDRLQQAEALLGMAGLERRVHGRLARARKLAWQAESLARQADNPLILALCLCQLGHVALASATTAQPALAEAELLAARSGAGAGSRLHAALARLRRAQAVFAAGQPERLLRGELPEELPEALRQRLVHSGRTEPSS